MNALRPSSARPLVDPFGRTITYLRVSVTDRCDFRCVYCMSEDMTFLPKRDVLTLEELDRLCSAFVRLGMRKLRMTGGEPLVRRDIMTLFRSLSRHLGDGRARRADADHQRLAARALRRRARAIAASGGSMFRSIRSIPRNSARSRAGAISTRCWPGIDAADRGRAQGQDQHRRAEGLNDAEATELIEWAHGRGLDITFIEVMPLGEVDERALRPISAADASCAPTSSAVHADAIALRTGGPARYFDVARDRRPARLHHAADP